MSKKPFQLRLDTEQLDRLARVAASMQMSKTEIVETGINMRLDLLEGYVAMDRGPPKKAKPLTMKPGGVNLVDGMADVAVIAGRVKAKARAKATETRSIRGYDAATGEPIYR